MRLPLSRALPTLVATVLAAALAPIASSAQASPYVPLTDPAYEDLELLVSTGAGGDLILGQKPYSEATFARAAGEARKASGGLQPLRIQEAIARILRRFGAMTNGAERRPEVVVLRSIGAEATWAGSPLRPMQAERTHSSELDADLAPLLQHNGGRILADGGTIGAEALLDLALGRNLAAQLAPRLSLSDARGSADEARVTLLDAYARAVLGNFAIEGGRVHRSHGHARTYGPVLSENARGFDLVRASMDRPARLPWIFRHLGPASFAFGAAYMGRNQDTPGSWLFTYEGAIKPHPNLEWGFILLNHQGGEGSPEATTWERIRDLLFLEERRFLPFSALPRISDKVLGGDLALLIPGVGATVYVEWMTTDDHNFFTEPATGLWHNAAWTGGVRVMGLGKDARTDVWVEGSHAGVLAYTHHQFTSGMALDRRVLGSPLGPLATGWEGGLRWTGPENVIQAVGAWERYSGDTWVDKGSIRVRTADNPDEIRLRATADWTRTSDGATGLRTQVKLGYEHVTRFNFTDQSRNNFLVQVSAGYVWN